MSEIATRPRIAGLYALQVGAEYLSSDLHLMAVSRLDRRTYSLSIVIAMKGGRLFDNTI